MAKRALWIGLGALLAVGLAGAGAVWWVSERFDPCENVLLDAQPSPDGDWVGVVFERNCGATTRLSTNVSLLPVGADPMGRGNVFVAEGTTAAIGWGGDGALEIAYGEEARIFLEETEPFGQIVRYIPQALPTSR